MRLTGAIVGELPTGAVAGIGARLLVGSYNGLTLMIWSALVAASVMAALLVWVIGFAEQQDAFAHGSEYGGETGMNRLRALIFPRRTSRQWPFS